MCQYRYYYYGGCQHQETILHNFCRAAEAAHTARCPFLSTEPDEGRDGSYMPYPGVVLPHAGSATAIESTYQTTQPCIAPSTPPQHEHSTTASSPSPSSSSSSSSKLSSLTSLTPSDFPPFNPVGTKELGDKMSALSTFTAANIRDMLSIKPKQSVLPLKPDVSRIEHHLDEEHHTPIGHPQHEQSGSAKRGDGSWELLTGSEYSDLTERGPYEAPQVTISSATDAPSGGYDTFEAYNSIASEIDTLKDEVDRLKRETDLEFKLQKKMPKSSYLRNKKTPPAAPRSGGSVRSKIPAPKRSSPAALPQKAHENNDPNMPAAECPVVPVVQPVSPLQFPDLEHKAAGKLPQHQSVTRKPAYTAITEYKGAQNSAEDTCSSQDSAGRKRQSVDSTRASAHSDLTNTTPHFAQSTVAAALRRESIRRDSAICLGMTTPPDGSPTKSTRSKGPRQIKRGSLPESWTDNSGNEDAEALAAKSHTAGPTINEVNTQQQSEPHAGRQTFKQDQSLRKKGSASYMSPTKATTLRNIATVGQENTSRTPPRVPRSHPLSLINTTVPSVTGPTSVESMVSDTGSAKIITEVRGNVTSANAAGHVFAGRKSPSGIIPSELRRRMTVGVSVADVLADHARSSGLLSVGHTTQKRRESTGDLLNPIKARLNKVGLLVGNVSEENRAGPSPIYPAMQSPRQMIPRSPLETEEASKPIVQVKPAFQPPHRRLRAAKAAEAASAVSAAKSSSNYAPAQALRATAAEFTPMSTVMSTTPKHVSAAATSAIPDWNNAVMFRTADEWASLSGEDKKIIHAARHVQRTGELPYGRIESSKHWQNLFSQYLATHQGLPLSYANVSSAGVVAGQKLKPHQVPGTNGLQWTVQDTNGEEMPIDFDGGYNSPQRGYITPPRGQRRMPTYSPDSWSIGANASNQNSFGWTGGAGREIRFVGYGPDAERDPNTPVSFNFRGGNTGSSSGNRNETGPRMIGEENFYEPPGAPLSPRSKAQWAKLKQYTKIPCGNVDITHAVELLPFPGDQQLAGYCNDCAFSSH